MDGELELQGLIRLQKRHMARAASVLAEAFADDPVFAYLLPEPASRRKAVEIIMRSVVARLMLSSESYATSEAMEGVLFVEFPGRRRFRLGAFPAMAGNLLLPFRLSRHVSLPELIGRARRISSDTIELRRRVKGLGRAAHVDMIAVGHEYRGRKFMSRMMRAALEEAGRRGLRCVLETETETNVRIYRHFGFTEEWVKEVAPGELTYHIMVYGSQPDGKTVLT